jgi:hypothetical protein
VLSIIIGFVPLFHETLGIYPKMTNGKMDVFLQVEEVVYIINGLGGAGMTLSFGFAEEVVETIK